MAEAVPSPRTDDTKAPDEQKKVHRAETKTKTTVEAKRQGPTLEIIKADERVRTYIRSANQQTGCSLPCRRRPTTRPAAPDCAPRDSGERRSAAVALD